jgi:hypothetical protein
MNKTHTNYVYHIYIKNKCAYHSLSESEFDNIWIMLQNLLEIMDTKEISKHDISFEKVSVNKEISLNSSH